jgi:hypothetical protein
MASIRQIRSIHSDDSSGQHQGSSGQRTLADDRMSPPSSSSWATDPMQGLAFGAPVISPPIQFHDIPIIKI